MREGQYTPRFYREANGTWSYYGWHSAIAGLAGSAFAASAQQHAEEQKKAAEAQAKATNKYNKKKFKANKKFTKEMREYNFETAMTRWRYEDLREREYGADEGIC